MIKAHFLKELANGCEHLEPPGLHAIKHVHQPSLYAVRAILERGALGQELEPLLPVLRCEVLTRRCVVVAIVRP